MGQDVEARKSRLAETLSDQYSRNLLQIEEYERLIEYVNKVETEKELGLVERLVDGLPAGGNSREAAYGYREGRRDDDRYDRGGAFRTIPGHLTILAHRIIDGGLRRGDVVGAILGQTEIILTEEDFRAGRLNLDCLVFMGEIVIRVPGNTRVINRVIPVLGDIQARRLRKATGLSARGDRLELELAGAVLAGAINVKPF